ncbi:MAG: hypothetical protein DSO07_12450 [Thermoproteota archaeon]|jgi:uncharacterized membrane protein|uniref:QueT transporter family protein n=1 Tax=Candidatus Methanodesulfokora washburnensis TaxID=2478471 RepID=A0A520KL71_9CREN|nr:MAG: QueT transporter family protein [Candidatus Methanodesulfokores washburnensis]TDA37555.1 MAG: hypothetical protein DSO07_12450 [Candidatus Korarchaeota archaeon]
MRSRNVALTAIIAALYAVLVIVFAPISFLLFQVRIADMLIPLSLIYGVPASIGLSLGCLVANSFGGLGWVDVIGGSIANLMAGLIGYIAGRGRGKLGRFFATVLQTAVVSIIVGTYLSFLLGVRLEISITGVLIGSLISINIMGFMLEEAIRRMKS